MSRSESGQNFPHVVDSYQARGHRAAVRLPIFSGRLRRSFDREIEKRGDIRDFHLEMCAASDSLIAR